MKRQRQGTGAGAQGPGTHGQEAFTLVEILVALALLGILTAVLVTTMTGSLSLNRQSQRQIGTASRAQDLIERVRGAWAAPAFGLSTNFAKACAELPETPEYTVEYRDLDARANPTDTAPKPVRRGNCAAQPAALAGSSLPPMRRLIVTSQTGGQDVALSLDILKPVAGP